MRGELSAMKQMGQEARLNYIVEELKKDSGSFRDMEVRPRDRRRVMRSLNEYPYARTPASRLPGDSG